jgi:DNA-binding MarR family transcriptional regulator
MSGQDKGTQRPGRRVDEETVGEADLQQLLAACRVLVAISARSIAAVDDVVDLAQFRVLVILSTRGPLSLAQLAESAGLGMSTASRTCDRMVGLGLLDRQEDPANRRQVVLTLTTRGRSVVHDVMRRRREVLESVVRQLPENRRRQLIESLGEFAAAGGEPAAEDLWSLGWTG